MCSSDLSFSAEKLAEHTAESDAALSQLEDAMDAAEERGKAAAQVLAPPPDPNASPAPAADATQTSPAGSEPAAGGQPPPTDPDSKD